MDNANSRRNLMDYARRLETMSNKILSRVESAEYKLESCGSAESCEKLASVPPQNTINVLERVLQNMERIAGAVERIHDMIGDFEAPKLADSGNYAQYSAPSLTGTARNY